MVATLGCLAWLRNNRQTRAEKVYHDIEAVPMNGEHCPNQNTRIPAKKALSTSTMGVCWPECPSTREPAVACLRASSELLRVFE